MFSNYSHDHRALDTLNIMANRQYIDQIMTNNQFYICFLEVKVSRQDKTYFSNKYSSKQLFFENILRKIVFKITYGNTLIKNIFFRFFKKNGKSAVKTIFHIPS